MATQGLLLVGTSGQATAELGESARTEVDNQASAAGARLAVAVKQGVHGPPVGRTPVELPPSRDDVQGQDGRRPEVGRAAGPGHGSNLVVLDHRQVHCPRACRDATRTASLE